MEKKILLGLITCLTVLTKCAAASAGSLRAQAARASAPNTDCLPKEINIQFESELSGQPLPEQISDEIYVNTAKSGWIATCKGKEYSCNNLPGKNVAGCAPPKMNKRF